MTGLVQFETAYRAVMVAKSIDEVKQIRDKMESLRLYLKQQGESLEMQNACAEIKLRAERKAGEILKEVPKNKGMNGTALTGNTVLPVRDDTPTLSDLGISKMQSSRFQAVASIPEETFEQTIAKTKASQEELTTRQLLSIAKRRRDKQQTPDLEIVLPLPLDHLTNGTQPFWKDDQIAVYNGDFRSLIENLPDGFIVTDPPYNIGFKYDTYQDNLSDSDYIEMISALRRFKKIAIIQYPEEMQRLIVPALGPPDHTSVWCYNSNTSRRFRLINWYGVIPDYSRIKQPYKNPTDRRVRQLIAEGNTGASLYEWWDDIQIVKNVSPEKGNHPCPVPERLIKRIITLGAEPGEVILDPFAGELTTLKAAKDLGHRAIGIELSKSYILGGLERLRQSLLQPWIGEPQ